MWNWTRGTTQTRSWEASQCTTQHVAVNYSKWKPPCSTNVNTFQHCRIAVAREWIVNANVLTLLIVASLRWHRDDPFNCCRHSSTNRTNRCVLWRKSSHLPIRPSSGKTVHKPKFCQIKCLFLPPLSSLKRCKRYFLTPCMNADSQEFTIFWKYLPPSLFPALPDMALRYRCRCSGRHTYMKKKTVSIVKYRSILTNHHLRNLLILATSSVNPNIK